MSNRESVRVLIPEDKLIERIAQVSAQINSDYEGKQLKVICILKGSIFFTCELTKRITVPLTIDFMRVSSYGGDTSSSGEVKIIDDLSESVENQDVLVIEDIIDSGNTLSKLIPLLEERKPASVAVCTLLDKPDRREVPLEVRYNCFEIPNEFVVGYGLDYDQKYRNLPFVGVLQFDNL